VKIPDINDLKSLKNIRIKAIKLPRKKKNGKMNCLPRGLKMTTSRLPNAKGKYNSFKKKKHQHAYEIKVILMNV
jgi:hypothetical protein